MSSRFLSVEDIAKDLGVTDETVRGYIRSGKLQAYRVGRDYKILKGDYDKFLEERKTGGQADGEKTE